MSVRTTTPISAKAVLSTTEAAQYINISNDEVRRLCKIGTIKAFRCGPNYKIPKRVLDDAIMEWAMEGIDLSTLEGEI